MERSSRRSSMNSLHLVPKLFLRFPRISKYFEHFHPPRDNARFVGYDDGSMMTVIDIRRSSNRWPLTVYHNINRGTPFASTSQKSIGEISLAFCIFFRRPWIDREKFSLSTFKVKTKLKLFGSSPVVAIRDQKTVNRLFMQSPFHSPTHNERLVH